MFCSSKCCHRNHHKYAQTSDIAMEILRLDFIFLDFFLVFQIFSCVLSFFFSLNFSSHVWIFVSYFYRVWRLYNLYVLMPSPYLEHFFISSQHYHWS